VQVYFNGHRIPSSRLDLDSSRITFSLLPAEFAAGDAQRLGLVAAPFRPARVADSEDTRELALPVAAVTFSPVDGEERG
jgi:hypothetical protein